MSKSTQGGAVVWAALLSVVEKVVERRMDGGGCPQRPYRLGSQNMAHCFPRAPLSYSKPRYESSAMIVLVIPLRPSPSHVACPFLIS